jgi:hypothetical protein
MPNYYTKITTVMSGILDDYCNITNKGNNKITELRTILQRSAEKIISDAFSYSENV